MARPKEMRSTMADCTDPSRGASAALDELSQNYAAYRERLAKELCRTFRSYRLTRYEAWDLADRALEKAVRSIWRFDPTEGVKLMTWLHTIARRCALDYVQSAQRLRVTVSLDDEKEEQRLPSSDDPAEVHERRRLAERVRAAVDSLPGGQRDAVHLCDFDGLSHEDAAVAMKVPLRRLRQLLYEGRAALGRNRKLRELCYGCDFFRKETRPRKSRSRGDDGVRG